MLGIYLGIGPGGAAPQEIAAMNGIDDPAAQRADGEAEHHHGKPGQRLLRDQKEGGVAHGRGQRRHNPAEGQPPGNILRHDDDRPAASGERAEAGSDRHLPDRVAPQHCRGVDVQRALKSVDDQEGGRNKGADLKIGIGN